MAGSQNKESFPDPTLEDLSYVELCLQAARKTYECSGEPADLQAIVAYIGRVGTLREQLRPQLTARLNDRFRRDCMFPLITPSVLFLRDPEQIIETVRDFDDFDAGNDPYGEHDFGAFNWDRDRIFWKIDYIDAETGYWRDPLDPGCQRILTIGTSDDY